jgi:hypothetical protein
MSINNVVIKTYYSNLTSLHDLISPSLVEVNLIIYGDNTEYINLLMTTLVSPNTTKNFPVISKDKQELNCRNVDISYDTVSIILKVV